MIINLHATNYYYASQKLQEVECYGVIGPDTFIIHAVCIKRNSPKMSSVAPLLCIPKRCNHVTPS